VTTHEFFIGWLPMPKSYARFLGPWTIVLLMAAVMLAVGMAAVQLPPGSARWNVDDEVTLHGQVTLLPYAALRIIDEQGQPRTVMIVSSGKYGALSRLVDYDRQLVSVRGTLLHRDDRWMLELLDVDNAIVPRSGSTIPEPQRQLIGKQKLCGEIIDSKCYLGAMRPGGDKTHKACAILCLKGGVPPMFITRDTQGKETYYLLTSPDGSSLSPECYNYVGDRVTVSGKVEHVGDLRILRLDVNDIVRQ
jgi:hypothetical protein